MKAMLWTGVCTLIVTAAVTGCATKEHPKPLPPAVTTETTRGKDSVQRSETVTVQAKVVAINQKTREVTLRGSDGKETTLHVDESVRNLPQVHKGDMVSIAYRRAIAFRLKKPGEADTGTKTASGLERAPLGDKPGGVAADAVQITATVTNVDRKNNEVTLKGPKGHSVTLSPEDPTVLDKVKKGDKVEATYTEAIAVSVDKP
jgi:hypothetical protein